jgi:hypothetical protein
VGPVPVIVRPTASASAIDTTDDVEIWMIGVDSGIQDRDVGIDQAETEKIPSSKDTTTEILLGIDTVNARWKSFCRGLDWKVGRDLNHVGVDLKTLR